MNKLNTKLFSAIIFALVIAFTGCKKEEVTGTNSSLGVATISGTAKISGEDNPTTKLSGAKVFARFNSEELVINTDTNKVYADRVYETTIDQAGKFTFTVDANVKQFTVTIDAQEFRTADKKYTSNGTSASVYKGKTDFVELVYSSTDL